MAVVSRIVAVAALLLLACLAPVHGQYANETAITTSSSTIRADQQDIAFNWEEGTFLLAYIHTVIGATPAEDQTSVMGKIIQVTGSIVQSTFTIYAYSNDTASPAYYRKTHPSVVFNPVDNQYLVVFQADTDVNGTTSGIWGGLFSHSGVISPAGIFRVSSSNSSREAHPTAVWNSDVNEYAVVWEVSNAFESSLGIVTFSSSVFTSSQLLFGVPKYFNKDPAIIYNPGLSSYLLVWTASNPNADNLADIWSTTILHGPNNTLVAAEMNYVTGVVEIDQTYFNTSHVGSSHPQLVGLDPTFLVWEVLGRSHHQYVAAMFISSDGNLASPLSGLAPEFIAQRPTAIYSDVANAYVVTYEGASTADENGNSISPGIRGVVVDNFLNVNSHFRLDHIYTDNERAPVIAGDGRNNSMVVWFHGDDAIPPDAVQGNSTIAVQRRQNAGPSEKPVIKGATRDVVDELSRRKEAHRLHVQDVQPMHASYDLSRTERIRQHAQRGEAATHTRATPITPPAFLVANPILVLPGSSSSSSGGNNGDGDGDRWVGGLVALVFLAVAVAITAVAVVVLLVIVIYKYREPIKARLANFNVSMPRLPRRDRFQQFHDEDEVPGL